MARHREPPRIIAARFEPGGVRVVVYEPTRQYPTLTLGNATPIRVDARSKPPRGVYLPEPETSRLIKSRAEFRRRYEGTTI